MITRVRTYSGKEYVLDDPKTYEIRGNLGEHERVAEIKFEVGRGLNQGIDRLLIVHQTGEITEIHPKSIESVTELEVMETETYPNINRDFTYCANSKDCPIGGECKRCLIVPPNIPLWWSNWVYDTKSKTCLGFVKK